MSVTELILRLTFTCLTLWLGVFIYSGNFNSVINRIIFIFLVCLSLYSGFVDIILSSLPNELQLSSVFDKLSYPTYLLPIPIILHLSILTTNTAYTSSLKYSLTLLYLATIGLTVVGFFTNYITDGSNVLYYSDKYGYFFERGILFPLIIPLILWSCILASKNYLIAIRSSTQSTKYKLALLGTVLYGILGPVLTLLYIYSSAYDLILAITAPFLIAPVLFWVIAILRYKLISDVEETLNIKELTYRSLSLLIIIAIYLCIIILSKNIIGKYYITAITVGLILTIITHGFYDWLTTFIRDLLYGGGRGFNIITDKDVTDLVKDFHRPELLEMNPFVRFRIVQSSAKKGRTIDAAQEIVLDAIEYFKQKDYPRRTKMNLKYQMLKMLTADDAEEGQILWELGFDGYPMKIMSGENGTRKPLFKVESMSDYTATSRNAFIALKKEALHDLGWRLSYIEKLHVKTKSI